jgi:hypothetical protein
MRDEWARVDSEVAVIDLKLALCNYSNVRLFYYKNALFAGVSADTGVDIIWFGVVLLLCWARSQWIDHALRGYSMALDLLNPLCGDLLNGRAGA